MKLPLSWLQDFVNLDAISEDEFCETFTQSIAEVVSVSKIHTNLQYILCAQIVDIMVHPQDKALYKCIVDTGKLQYEVVTPLKGLKNNLIVPFAPIGATVFPVLPLQSENQGLILSEADLQLGTSKENTIILGQNTFDIGKTLNSVLNITEETVIEIDNNSLSHRPDLWGIYGIARECAALFQRPFQSLENEKQKNEQYFSIEQHPLSLQIDSHDCLAYAIFYVNNLAQYPQTPWKIRQRLVACNMKPINLLVDLSNYVMLEMGIPNHFFDRATIRSGKIRVAQSDNPSRKVLTIDNQEHSLSSDDLLIFDNQDPLAIAGIIGLKHSCVSHRTTNIVVEGGIWNPQIIRKTSNHLNLRTEASIRYEKALDPHMLMPMLLRCAQLIYTFCPRADILGPIQMGIPLTSLPEESIILDLKRVQKLLNINFEISQAQNILEMLGFTVHINSDHILHVNPPSWRRTRDKIQESDLVEEIGRMIGYHHIKPSIPYFPVQPKKLPTFVEVKRKIQDFLVYRGQALEIFSNPLIGKKLIDLIEWPIKNENLVLPHAISPDYNRFRPSLVPSLLAAVLLNQKYFDQFKLFEIGHVAQRLDQEVQNLGYIHVQKEKNAFMKTVDLLDQLVNCLGISVDFLTNPVQLNPLLPQYWIGKHPNETLHLQWNQKTIGYITSLNPYFCQSKKIQGYVTLFEIDLSLWNNDIQHSACINYQPLMKYPGSILDFTILAQHNISVKNIIKCIHTSQKKPTFITDIKIADIFEQNDNCKAVTLRVWLNCYDHTLLHEEIQINSTLIIKILEEHGFPLKN